MRKVRRIIGIAGAVITAAMLIKKETDKWFGKKNRVFNSRDVKELGRPSKMDDAKMVDEGALTSVQYYNELQDIK